MCTLELEPVPEAEKKQTTFWKRLCTVNHWKRKRSTTSFKLNSNRYWNGWKAFSAKCISLVFLFSQVFLMSASNPRSFSSGATMTRVRARKPGAPRWLQSPSRRLFKIRINRYPPLKVHQKNGLERKPTFALTHAKLPSLLLVSGWMPTSNRPADNPVKSLFPEHLAPDYCDLILLFTLLTNTLHQ